MDGTGPGSRINLAMKNRPASEQHTDTCDAAAAVYATVSNRVRTIIAVEAITTDHFGYGYDDRTERERKAE